MTNPYYETGNCSSLSDFFDKLFTFACSSSIDSGYRFTEETVTSPQSLDYNGDSGSDSYTVRCLSRDGYYWWVRFSLAYGWVYHRIAPNGGSAAWNSVAGRPYKDTAMWPIPGAGVYHFFSVDGSIHAVCVLSSGAHVHMNFGKLNKVGDWVGGEYFTSSYTNPSGDFNNADNIGASSNRYICQISNGGRPANAHGIMHCVYNGKQFAYMDDYFYNNADPTHFNTVRGNNIVTYNTSCQDGTSPNSFTPYNTASADVEYQLHRAADDDLFYDVGTMPGIRFVNMALLNPGDPINTDWMVFPLSFKGNVGSNGIYAATGNIGVAYYKGP